jgi:hypothetical protein
MDVLYPCCSLLVMPSYQLQSRPLYINPSSLFRCAVVAWN